MTSSLCAIFFSIIYCTMLAWSSGATFSRVTRGVKGSVEVAVSPRFNHEWFVISSRDARPAGSRTNITPIKLQQMNLYNTHHSSLKTYQPINMRKKYQYIPITLVFFRRQKLLGFDIIWFSKYLDLLRTELYGLYYSPSSTDNLLYEISMGQCMLLTDSGINL